MLLRGRFCGCGTTKPSRLRIRQIVEMEGAGAPVLQFSGEVVGDRARPGIMVIPAPVVPGA
jgi:hypothetical protein